jgi:hypothetical protein
VWEGPRHVCDVWLTMRLLSRLPGESKDAPTPRGSTSIGAQTSGNSLATERCIIASTIQRSSRLVIRDSRAAAETELRNALLESSSSSAPLRRPIRRRSYLLLLLVAHITESSCVLYYPAPERVVAWVVCRFGPNRTFRNCASALRGERKSGANRQVWGAYRRE